jgi:hypothetical protein
MVEKTDMGSGARYDGVQVFSATTFGRRDKLGEDVTAWLRAHPGTLPVKTCVLQSSDSRFHCLTIVLFWRREESGG